jgi:hypothetical protein
MRTRRAFHREFSLGGSIYTCRVVPTPCALQQEEVAPDAKRAVKILISVL